MTEAGISEASASFTAGGREQRLVKLQRLVETGHAAFGRAFPDAVPLAELRAAFEEGKPVKAAAGRLITVRDMGKSIFADLQDGSGRFQVYAGKSNTTDFDALKFLDPGDYIGVEGELFVTRAGEKTIRIQTWTLLTKALRPLPEKWHGLRDVEIRYRQRYLDLIANPQVRELFQQRSRVIREIRAFLWERGFLEVETPMMQSQPGGATARPFKTHYTALSAEMFLRIAPELYLKRLLVGGMDRVFELNRNFRNEGLSKTHNPEFTMLEVYQAFSDRKGMQALVQDLIAAVALKVFGKLQLGSPENPIDLTLPWREVAYRDLIQEKMGADWHTLAVGEARKRAEAMGMAIDPSWDLGLITHEIYEKTIERTLQQPVFVTRLPRELVPLAKVCEDDPSVVDVFELVIGGKEIAPGYSELNDPLEQRKRLEAQAGEDAQKVDEEFLLALEHGMPPAGGMGVGIDRLIMIFTGAEAIRDVILFPQLRPSTEH
ncbi:MAG: lysine--tRNA ligase [Verrucomicrobia bacterium]|nr:lysine--tRNA ligase [Verrucomicrobiota bacterium]MBU4291885.1 lysine--tRNA ligase [Verrucomicrobiota bacterium]MBU4429814.1 lysine--tRNA ligase [Verrucomicrobiota bacterium]MCG2680279.1 lysine--tRNA ligase [Kiritimatiellia bacterium]